MKLIQTAAMVVLLLTSVAVHAQTSDDTATKFIPPVIVKDKEPVTKGEKMKQKYKSKEWHQGMEVATDTSNGANDKQKLGRLKNMKKLRRPTPPPPPPALPSNP